MIKKVLDPFGRWSRASIIGLSFLWMASVGALDYAVGFELSLFPLYWPALCPATWYCGASWGYALGVLSVAFVTIGDVLHHSWSHPIVLWANAATRLAAFAMLVWVLAKLREAYDRESLIRRESQAAAALKGELVSLMGHEINNALTLLKTTAFLMREDEPEPSAHRQESYAIIDRVLFNMELMSRNFLDNARMESGRLKVNPEPVDIGRHVEEAVKIFSPIMKQRSLKLSVELPPLPALALVDEAALVAIVNNLVGNALKYTPNGGRIEIKVARTKAARPSVRISITDTGIGIAPKDKKRISEGFVRLPEGELMAKGFGLGLKTVHGLLQLHGAHLEIESVLGQGSTFSFVLPLAETRQAS